MGLVLARTWSAGDNRRLKSHDPLDIRAVIEEHGLARGNLERRARELGCARSLELLLRRYDPWRERLDLQAPSFWERQRWYLAVASERGHMGLERFRGLFSRLLGTALDVVRHLPVLLRAKRLLESGHELQEVLATTDAPAEPTTGALLREKERIVRGIKWGTRLLQPHGDLCLLRSLALFLALRARGGDVIFYYGTKLSGGVLQSHAWIRLPNLSSRDLEDVEVYSVDRVLLRYPDESTGDFRKGFREHDSEDSG